MFGIGWLRDGIWQFVGATLALIAIFITLKQNNRKKISYEILTDIDVFNTRDNNSELKLHYKKTLINKPRLIEIKIYNSGNIPISKVDYERPIEIIFATSSIIIDAEVVETHPPNIETQISKDGSKLYFSSGVFNSGDIIKIRVLLDGDKGQTTIQGRVAGVKQIQENLIKKMQFQLPSWVWDINGILCAGAVLGVSLALLFSRISGAVQGWYLLIFAIFIGCLGGISMSRETSTHDELRQRTSPILAGVILFGLSSFFGIITLLVILPLL